jgi:hypothetical protein
VSGLDEADDFDEHERREEKVQSQTTSRPQLAQQSTELTFEQAMKQHEIWRVESLKERAKQTVINWYLSWEGNEHLEPQNGEQWINFVVQNKGWDFILQIYKDQWSEEQIEEQIPESLDEEEEIPDSPQEFRDQVKEWWREAPSVKRWHEHDFDQKYWPSLLKAGWPYILETLNARA